MEFDTGKIEQAAIKAVADEIMSDDQVWERAKAAVDARINKLFKEVVDEQIRQHIETAIKNGFDHAYQKVDSFGRPVGTETTIRAELEKMIAGYWNQRVDTQGKPSDNTYGTTTTRAEWLMTQMCADDFKGAMKQHVVNVSGSLKDHFRAELHQTVNRMLADVFKVRSLDDQGKSRSDSSLIAPVAGEIGA